MYTSIMTVREGDDMRLVSYGRGAAYALEDKATGKAVWFEGDDATELESELKAIDRTYPDWSDGQVLSWLWFGLGYGEAAT